MNAAPSLLLAVALGGALGSVGRYLALGAWGLAFGTAMPWGTVAVNGLGSLVMGVLVELGALAWQPSPEVRAFLTVGVLGGFTTFSTFSLDVALLIERNDWTGALAYALLSVLLSVGGLFLGLALVRQFAA